MFMFVRVSGICCYVVLGGCLLKVLVFVCIGLYLMVDISCVLIEFLSCWFVLSMMVDGILLCIGLGR